MSVFHPGEIEAQVRAGIQEMRGVRMPQLVRREIVREPGEAEITFQHQLNSARRHARRDRALRLIDEAEIPRREEPPQPAVRIGDHEGPDAR